MGYKAKRLRFPSRVCTLKYFLFNGQFTSRSGTDRRVGRVLDHPIPHATEITAQLAGKKIYEPLMRLSFEFSTAIIPAELCYSDFLRTTHRVLSSLHAI